MIEQSYFLNEDLEKLHLLIILDLIEGIKSVYITDFSNINFTVCCRILSIYTVNWVGM